MKLVWLPAAQADIQRLYNFLRERDPRAAERAIRVMQLGTQRLTVAPCAGASTRLLGSQVRIQPGSFCLWKCGRWRW